MLRIIFFGMQGQFSIPPLQALLKADINVVGVVLAASDVTGLKTSPFPQRLEPPSPVPSALPLATPYVQPTCLHLAWAHGLPIWAVKTLREANTVQLLQSLAVDVICVACFPLIFPATLLAVPRYGCLNIHPSLLPAYRGPDPLFWAKEHNQTRWGVTLHCLDEGIDTGPIVSQAVFDVPPEIAETELESRCAHLGSHLLVAALKQLARGSLFTRPQDEI